MSVSKTKQKKGKQIPNQTLEKKFTKYIPRNTKKKAQNKKDLNIEYSKKQNGDRNRRANTH